MRELVEIRNRLLAEYRLAPQVCQQITLAFREMEHALTQLNRLGQRFWLTNVPPSEPEYAEYKGWPKIMFHVAAAPNGREVRSPYHLDDLGKPDGKSWYDTLEAAQHADGMDAQFAGRGGVKKGTALTLVS